MNARTAWAWLVWAASFPLAVPQHLRLLRGLGWPWRRCLRAVVAGHWHLFWWTVRR